MRIEGNGDLLLGLATGLTIRLAKGSGAATAAAADQRHEQRKQTDNARTIHVVSICRLTYAKCLRQRFIYKNLAGWLILSTQRNCK